jgi:hypothetical protein
MDVDRFSDAKVLLSQTKPLELCCETAVTSLDNRIASPHNFGQCAESPIPLEIDTEGSDTCDEDYVASQFECCLQEIEVALLNRVTLLERTNIYLDKLKNLHNYMLLPPEKFEDVDDALSKLLACKFPQKIVICCNSGTVNTGKNAAVFHTQDEESAFHISELQFVVSLHENKHVCKSHTCRLPQDWVNRIYW